MAHVELIRYTAKRTEAGLKDLKREVIRILPMDANMLLDELAKILEPGFSEYIKNKAG